MVLTLLAADLSKGLKAHRALKARRALKESKAYKGFREPKVIKVYKAP